MTFTIGRDNDIVRHVFLYKRLRADAAAEEPPTGPTCTLSFASISTVDVDSDIPLTPPTTPPYDNAAQSHVSNRLEIIWEPCSGRGGVEGVVHS